MISADTAMAGAFAGFFLVFGKVLAKNIVSFLDVHKKEILLSMQHSEYQLSCAQEHLCRAKIHQKEIADRIKSLATTLRQETECLMAEQKKKSAEIKNQYKDLYAQSLKVTLDKKRTQIEKEIIGALKIFVLKNHIGKDLGVHEIIDTLNAKEAK